VGQFVLESVRTGKKPSDSTAEEMRQFGINFPKLMNQVEGMQTRNVPGGTGAQAVAQALAEARERLNEMIA
jgi:hypothetical protein